MHHRLKLVRKSLGLTQAEIAKQLALDRSYYSQLETGKAPLVSRWVNLIIKLFNVNQAWLETGEGEMFVAPSKASSTAAAFDLDATVDEFVAAVAKLPREMQELVAKIGLSVCDKLDLSPLRACADGTTDKGNSQQD